MGVLRRTKEILLKGGGVLGKQQSCFFLFWGFASKCFFLKYACFYGFKIFKTLKESMFFVKTLEDDPNCHRKGQSDRRPLRVPRRRFSAGSFCLGRERGVYIFQVVVEFFLPTSKPRPSKNATRLGSGIRSELRKRKEWVTSHRNGRET